MRKTIGIFGLLMCTLFAGAQEGSQFPELTGQTVKGKVIELPKALQGKYALVGMSWSRKAEEAFETWVNPCYNKFILKSGMMDGLYDINVYFIPMFTGTKKGAMDNVMKRMEAESDEEIFPYVLFYKGDLEPYEKALHLKDPSKPYIFLIDPNGKVVLSESGHFTEDKMLEIEKILLEN
ncbi:hypothetical protein KFE98_13430 [bacterium SCSIO 12741]|nr:hypothetical protein KFE98_13430 [bacterium SCSIO 12741]